MAQASLVDSAVDAGARLIERLSDTPFAPESALWFYRPDSDDWVLLLGSTAVRAQGQREGYILLESLIRSNEFQPMNLDDIVLTDNDDPLLQLLRSAVKTGRSLGRIRFSRNRIGNAFVDDAMIYRLQDSAVEQPT